MAVPFLERIVPNSETVCHVWQNGFQRYYHISKRARIENNHKKVPSQSQLFNLAHLFEGDHISGMTFVQMSELQNVSVDGNACNTTSLEFCVPSKCIKTITSTIPPSKVTSLPISVKYMMELSSCKPEVVPGECLQPYRRHQTNVLWFFSHYCIFTWKGELRKPRFDVSTYLTAYVVGRKHRYIHLRWQQ